MIRISSTFSSKLALATSITIVTTIPIMIVLWMLDAPTPWKILGADEYFKETNEDLGAIFGAYSSFTFQWILNTILIWPICFIYSFWAIPSRLIISDEGLRIKNFGKEKHYTFEQVRGFKLKQGEPRGCFLKLKLHRHWYTFEVDYGQVRTLNKYLPMYLNEEPIE